MVFHLLLEELIGIARQIWLVYEAFGEYGLFWVFEEFAASVECAVHQHPRVKLLYLMLSSRSEKLRKRPTLLFKLLFGAMHVKLEECQYSKTQIAEDTYIVVCFVKINSTD